MIWPPRLGQVYVVLLMIAPVLRGEDQVAGELLAFENFEDFAKFGNSLEDQDSLPDGIASHMVAPFLPDSEGSRFGHLSHRKSVSMIESPLMCALIIDY